MKIPLKSEDRLRKEQARFGFTWRNGELTESKSEQMAISKIKELRNNGFSIRRIVRFMNEEKYPCRKAGALWHIKTVYGILSL